MVRRLSPTPPFALKVQIVMAIPCKVSVSLRVGVALLACAIWACSSGDEPKQGGGKSEPVASETAGAAGAEASPSSGGKGAVDDDDDDGEPVEGTGNTGSVGEPGEGEGRGGRGGSDSMEEPAAGGRGDEEPEPEPEPTGPSEAFLRGEALVEEHGCVTCHQHNFAGFSVFPNITPDETTGIGSWTDEQIALAIRTGVDAAGETMCPTMLRYDLTDAETSDVVAFLRGIPAVENKLAGVCPGHGE